MSNPFYAVHHHTVATPLSNTQGEGWEFVCKECSFQTRYFLPDCSQAAHLDVISLGDSSVRHLSEISNQLISPERSEAEPWLTPELRQTLEKISRKLDC